MIYIVYGDNLKDKNSYIKDITQKSEIFLITPDKQNRDIILSYSANNSLFGEKPVIIIDNLLTEENIILTENDWQILKESETIFIFKEDKFLVSDQNKFKKHGTIKGFKNEKIIPIEKFNIFSITDAFSMGNKMNTWTIYHDSIHLGIEPEAVAGVLFWKIKNMILNGSKIFSREELVIHSSNIVSLYHKAHNGEADFAIGLEQFILTSLSSK